MQTEEQKPMLNPQTMVLTEQETGWALDIKQALQDANKKVAGGGGAEDGDENAREEPLIELTDYEYALYALVTHGDTDEALERIENMQYFKQEYRINDTLEQAVEIVEAYNNQQPWYTVSVDYSAGPGHYVIVYDYSKLNPAAVDYPEDWRIFLGGIYYTLNLCQGNLKACREGLVHICECEGMWYTNFSLDLTRKCWHHLIKSYPLINKEISWLHTPLVGNIMHACFKSLMGEFADVVRVGCHFDGYDGRIDEMFKTPSEAIAKTQLLERQKSYLEVRYHNQKTFQLPLDPDQISFPILVNDTMALAAASDDDNGDDAEL